MLKKTRNTVFKNDNLLSTQYLSISRRVPVASKQVRVASKCVGVASEVVPVASRQVPMGYISAWGAGGRSDVFSAGVWNSRPGNRQTESCPLQFGQARQCGRVRAGLATLSPERPARLVWEKRS